MLAMLLLFESFGFGLMKSFRLFKLGECRGSLGLGSSSSCIPLDPASSRDSKGSSGKPGYRPKVSAAGPDFGETMFAPEVPVLRLSVFFIVDIGGVDAENGLPR